MDFLRKHWYDVGGVLALATIVLLLIFYSALTNYELLMWLSLISLFLHQLEEYRIVATFPGMINSVMFKSKQPDRFPLNSNTSLIINVYIGWTLYIGAAIAGETMLWLGMAAILVSLGNLIAHTFVFNIKGKTIYNAGLATSWLLFAPCVYAFFVIIHQENLASPLDYFIGIPLGVAINIFGVLKPIEWLADSNTKFIFNKRQVLPKDR